MGIPTGIILIVLLILAFKVIYRPDDIQNIRPEKALGLRGTVPAADLKENIILGVVFFTVFLWIGPSLIKGVMPELYATINSWSTAMPPLLGCIILFITKVDGERLLNFKEATTKGILWGSILMTGAATWLGSCLTNADIGISDWLTVTLSPLTASLPIMGMVVFFMTWAVLETNFSSNIVTTTVVSAVALSVLTALPAGSVSVGTVVCMVGFAAGVSSMTPAGPEYGQYRGNRFRLDDGKVHVYLGRFHGGHGNSGAELCNVSAGKSDHSVAAREKEDLNGTSLSL